MQPPTIKGMINVPTFKKILKNQKNVIGYYKNLAIIICYHRGDIFIPFCWESTSVFVPSKI
jgi:hypothetical protein